MADNILSRVKRILWAACFLSLPVTNFPYFPPGFGGKVSVRPLLIYPLILLIILVTIPAMFKRRLPSIWLPFLVFIVLAVFSSTLPVINGFVSEIKEVSVFSRTVRTVITLGLGAAIYLTVSIYPRDEENLSFALKWLYIGMAVALLWGTLQVLYTQDLIPGWYKIMRKAQKHISINRGDVNRIIGMTQEPSWFADQISALWLPWLFPAVLLNTTVFRKRWGWLTLEKLFFVWLLSVLVFTLSRGGLVVAAAVIGAGVVFFRGKGTINIPKSLSGFPRKVYNLWLKIPGVVRLILVGGVLAAGAAGVIYFVSLQSSYISRMWEYWIKPSGKVAVIGSKSLSGYFRYVGFGPRFINWETAYLIFKNRPLFGVGLGNYTFHFLENLPAVSIGYEPEILSRLVPGNLRVITPKNYLARLLAETGFLGTAAFLTFLMVLTLGGLYLWLAEERVIKFWGAGALLGIFAFLVDTFSYDSFAIPNPWIVFGLITAAVRVYHQPDQRTEITSE